MKYDWKQSIYSDCSSSFVSNPEPSLGEELKVSLCMDAAIHPEAVILSLIRNGEADLIDMTLSVSSALKSENSTGTQLSRYEASFIVTQYRMQYQFFIINEGRIYYYNQLGVYTSMQDRKHDFVLMADYHQPAWVKNSVFYQIFPDRFYNGNPDNDVKDGEYQVNGYDTIQIKDWNTPAAVYDKVHCADFYGGDLEGVIAKIPYLKELGVTAIYLNPIFLAPSVHKYDCIDYLHVDPHFGGDQTLADLTSALHENDMKLIVDISINHTGTAHKWFNKDGLFFDKSIGAYHNPDSPERAYYMIQEDGTYICWYGDPSLPKMDFSNPALRDALYRSPDSVIQKWLKPPYSIDGWRFDVADCMANYNENQLAPEVWPEIRTYMKQVNPDCYMLAENWDDCTDYLQGSSWDSPMNYYGYGRIIRQFYGAPDPYYERSEQLNRVTGHLSAEEFRSRVEGYLSRIPFALWQNQYNLFDSHDTGRFHIYPGITSAKYRGAVIGLFTMIGCPSIYYGDEAGIDGRTGFFEGGRYPFPWNSGFENSEIFNLYKRLGQLRKEHACLREGGFKFLLAENQVVAYARFDEKEAIVTILSASPEAQTIELPIQTLGLDPHANELEGQALWLKNIPTGELALGLAPEGSLLLQFSR